MAALAPSTRLDEAAEDLRRWERKIRAARGWLHGATRSIQWEGRGADAFQTTAQERMRQLDAAAEALQAARRALADAHEDVRRHRRDIEAAEQAYATLKAAGALPPAASGTPPPAGDASWPQWLQQSTGRAA